MLGESGFVGEMADGFRFGFEEPKSGTVGGTIGHTGVGAGSGDLRSGHAQAIRLFSIDLIFPTDNERLGEECSKVRKNFFGRSEGED